MPALRVLVVDGDGHGAEATDGVLQRVEGTRFEVQFASSLDEVRVILLTGPDHRAGDLQAGELGIADCLAKDGLDPHSLERSIRLALDHQRVLRELDESEQRYALTMADATDGLLARPLAAEAAAALLGGGLLTPA